MSLTPQMLDFFHEVSMEVTRADNKHGDWSDRTTTYCAEKIQDEANEVASAAAIGDITGRHGVAKESIQVAAVAFKMYRKHFNDIFLAERGF